MKAIDLAAIRERAEKATAGPWEAFDYRDGDERADTWLGVIQGAFEIITERFQVGRVKYSALPQSENIANAAFIAHARADIPTLLDEVSRLTAALREYGKHTVDCDAWHTDDDGEPKPCSCGFTEASS